MKLVLLTLLVLAAYAAVVLTQTDGTQPRPDVTSLRAGRYCVDLHVTHSGPAPLVSLDRPSPEHDWSSPSLVPYLPVRLHLDRHTLSRTAIERTDGSSSLPNNRDDARPTQHRPAVVSSVIAALRDHTDVHPPADGARVIYTVVRSLKLNVEHVLGNSTGITVGYVYRTESQPSTRMASLIVSFSRSEHDEREENRPYTLSIDFTF